MEERKECVFDFYRLIDTIDINQIRFTDFYRLIVTPAIDSLFCVIFPIMSRFEVPPPPTHTHTPPHMFSLGIALALRKANFVSPNIGL